MAELVEENQTGSSEGDTFTTTSAELVEELDECCMPIVLRQAVRADHELLTSATSDQSYGVAWTLHCAASAWSLGRLRAHSSQVSCHGGLRMPLYQASGFLATPALRLPWE